MGTSVFQSEVWKPVAGFEGIYEVSDHGRVRSLARIVPIVDGASPARRVPAKVLSPGTNSSGYLHVTLFRAGVRRLRKVHHLVLDAFFGDCPEGCQALHGNAIRNDNRISNLRWGTAKENAADRDMHGNQPRGADSWNAKFEDADIRDIRRAYSDTEATLLSLAEKYGVCISTIWYIVKNLHWSHVTEEPRCAA